MTKVTPIVLCGGRGERLWPLSRKVHAKTVSQASSGPGRKLFSKERCRVYRATAYATPLVRDQYSLSRPGYRVS